MSEPNSGGPAFPMPPAGTGDPRDGMAGGHDGMSLRAWLAGQALSSRGLYGANVREKELAEECCKIADALIAELEKETP